MRVGNGLGWGGGSISSAAGEVPQGPPQGRLSLSIPPAPLCLTLGPPNPGDCIPPQQLLGLVPRRTGPPGRLLRGPHGRWRPALCSSSALASDGVWTLHPLRVLCQTLPCPGSLATKGGPAATPQGEAPHRVYRGPQRGWWGQLSCPVWGGEWSLTARRRHGQALQQPSTGEPSGGHCPLPGRSPRCPYPV